MRFFNLIYIFLFLNINAGQVYEIELNSNKYKIEWDKEIKSLDPEFNCSFGKIAIFNFNKEIGHILYGRSLDNYYISSFIIYKEFRRFKIGSSFLKHIMNKLANNNAKQISLLANPFDLSSEENHSNMLDKLIAFYKSCGFVAYDKDRPDYLVYYPKNK